MAGLYFEDLSVGQEFRHLLTRVVTEMDNTAMMHKRPI